MSQQRELLDHVWIGLTDRNIDALDSSSSSSMVHATVTPRPKGAITSEDVIPLISVVTDNWHLLPASKLEPLSSDGVRPDSLDQDDALSLLDKLNYGDEAIDIRIVAESLCKNDEQLQV